MADDINENKEFNNYTDATQIGKRIVMAPDPTVLASKLMITKIRVTRVMHLHDMKIEKKCIKGKGQQTVPDKYETYQMM